MKRVELLAPAGNYESFLGAIRAGADAVYLAGDKFGARAYADNFSEEEVCKAIRYAHLFEKKVYLTINILLKQEELETLYEYLLPFYQDGLDGVIIQDMGVFCYIREYFPRLELHVSTQMAITGAGGARLLKEAGASRIVPARELSLDEIKAIKQEVCIEIETFVHGAMCYCYSGKCLFSSILGGRSGNRGRCAQPCRLPYEVIQEGKVLTKGEQYPLSLKDLCTLQMIPELLEAGIDSFKIEGRMKKPEYAAGVTALYRKNIDKYYAAPHTYKVEQEDIEAIQKLYIRSEIQDGYYRKHNGKEMVTISKPSYSGTEEALLAEIRQKYIEGKQQLAITGQVILRIGEAAKCIVSSGEVSVTVVGDFAEEASGRPLQEDAVRKQIMKTGASPFLFTELEIKMDTNLFLSLKSCNELRREALAALEYKLLESSFRSIPEVTDTTEKHFSEKEESAEKIPVFAVSVRTKPQFEIAVKSLCADLIYVPSDCFFEGTHRNQEKVTWYLEQSAYNGKALYVMLPHILRKRSYSYLEQLRPVLEKEPIAGVLARNLEELLWLETIKYQGKIVTDASLYCFNREAKQYFKNVSLQTVPYELNLKELLRLGIKDMEIPVYGRIPMMITANCIKKTAAHCDKSENGILAMKDRLQKDFPVVINCMHCYNVIYNTQPSSLHGYIETFLRHGIGSARLDFTVESAEEINKIITFFEATLSGCGQKAVLPYSEYTKGHLGRGVE